MESTDVCVNISIIGDDKVEGHEDFRIIFEVLSSDNFQNDFSVVRAVIYEDNYRKQTVTHVDENFSNQVEYLKFTFVSGTQLT